MRFNFVHYFAVAYLLLNMMVLAMGADYFLLTPDGHLADKCEGVRLNLWLYAQISYTAIAAIVAAFIHAIAYKCFRG